MNKTLVAVVISSIFFFILGYAVGNFFPIGGDNATTGAPPDTDQSTDTTSDAGTGSETGNTDQTGTIPEGKGLLEVTVTGSGGEPMVGIEVDVNYAPGEPESWGVAEADTNGITRYELEPGDYSVYFNSNRFPPGYIDPGVREVTVEEGELTSISIILQES
jgi:hypothetical protein